MSSASNAEPAPHAMWIERARDFASAGQMPQAEQAYLQALAHSPKEPEALNFVGMCAVRRGEALSGTLLVKKAAELQPGNAAVLCNLGLCYEAAGEWELALDAFGKSLRAAPDFFDARLHLGYALEQLQRSHEALTQYFGAIFGAQGSGLWTAPSSTPPNLQALVAHAMRYVNAGRHALFDAVLEPLRQQHGHESLSRVEQALAIYLLEFPAQYADARQRPTFLYVPGLPAQPFPDRRQFGWIEQYEASAAAIGEELAAVLAADRGLEAVHSAANAGQLRKLLASTSGTPVWDAFFFHRHGRRYDDNCRRCPQTVAALERLPIARIRDHAPEIFFSILKPDTHILPHRGVSNVRLVTHLPLIVPAGCALSVAGEMHEWREGSVTVFDDTYEHEAWNRGTETRVVLIADIWNPHLSETERLALDQLVGAIGDFNRDCGID